MSATTNTNDQTNPATRDSQEATKDHDVDPEKANSAAPLNPDVNQDCKKQRSPCQACCYEECKRSNWGLGHETPDLFVFNQWTQRPSVVFIVYRQVVSLFFSTILVYSIAVFEGPTWKWFIYLTHWTFTVLSVTEILKTSLAYVGYVRSKHAVPEKGHQVCPEMTVLMKIAWVFNNVSATLAPVITVVYWVAVYGGWELDIRSITSHALNTTYVVIDWCITGLPARFLHWYQPMTYVTIYGIFTVIYWVAGGTSEDGDSYIYAILDYSKAPAMAMGWIVVVLIFVFVVHAGHFGVVKLRQRMHSRTLNTQVNDEMKRINDSEV